MELVLEQKQTQSLSYAMIESVRILQMTRSELMEHINELSLENPLLDIEAEPGVPAQDVSEGLKKLEWLAGFDEQNKSYYYQDYEGEQDWIENIPSPKGETLSSVLMEQLISRQYSDKDLQIFEYIAGCIDPRGYYTGGTDTISSYFGISNEEASHYLQIMKSLNPAGVCAETLSECLILQLDRCEKIRGENDVEKEIVKYHLEELAKGRTLAIAKRLKLPASRICSAKDKITKLNPKPGSGYSEQEITGYVVPDITVTASNGALEAELNANANPTFRISKQYLDMAHRQECPEDVRRYIADKAKEIELLKNNIERRGDTLKELALCLIKEQHDFFQKGKLFLRPLRMKDVAECLGLHESTVSRAASGKYLQCKWGTFSLGYFFSKGYGSESSNGEIATQLVKEKLKAVINNEDKSSPYSDQKLSEIFASMGIEIARRTVAKYRDELGIADCRARKSISVA